MGEWEASRLSGLWFVVDASTGMEVEGLVLRLFGGDEDIGLKSHSVRS